MAISLDTSTNGGNATATSLTFSHTCSGSNRALFVSIDTDTADNTDYVTGVTYGGVAMTRIGTFQSQGQGGTYFYGLLNPSSGANDVIVSLSSSKSVYANAASYRGVRQTGLPDSTNQDAADPTTSLTVNTTTVADKCWIVSCAGRKFGSGATISAGSGLASRQINGPSAIGDSGGVKSPAGAYGSAWDLSGSTGLCVIVASIAPAPEEGSSFLLNFV